MDIKIRYLSKTGNTKMIALEIAKELNIEAKTIKEPANSADILFLGGALYADKISSSLRKFINTLDNNIKQVVIFGTSASEKTVYDEIKNLLGEKNIVVNNKTFNCQGNFLFYLHGRPNKEDLDNAKDFAKDIIMSFDK